MKIGTLTTGAAAVTTISINFLPQYITFTATTQITSLKVTVEGDGVILDLDADGLNYLSSLRRFGNPSNGVMIPLADGLVSNKTVEMVFTNSAAQTPAIYANSMGRGENYILTNRSKVLANSAIEFKKFAALGVKGSTTADEINIEYQDGTLQRYENTELPFVTSMYQNDVNDTLIDNVEMNLRSVRYLPSTDRTIYVTRYAPIGDLQSQ